MTDKMNTQLILPIVEKVKELLPDISMHVIGNQPCRNQAGEHPPITLIHKQHTKSRTQITLKIHFYDTNAWITSDRFDYADPDFFTKIVETAKNHKKKMDIIMKKVGDYI